MKKFVKIISSSIISYIALIFIGAYLTLTCQQLSPYSNIKDYYDALWWSLNATSIGDSNVFPITPTGRIIGAFLIIIGYGLFTINVATISSFLNHLINNKHKNN